MSLKRICAAALAGAAACVVCSASADLTRLAYNNAQARPFLKVGLWAWPMVMDWDEDGDQDLVVSCHDVPSNGTYLFENPGGDVTPVFKAGVRIEKGQGSVVCGRPREKGRRPDVFLSGHRIRDFRKTGYQKRETFGDLPRNVHTNRVRGNVWRPVDYDGDGCEDVLIGIGDWNPYTLPWEDKQENFTPDGTWRHPPVDGLVYWSRGLGRGAYAPVSLVRLKNGQPLWVNGNPMPMAEDWDGDGDLDILCGEFVDGFTYFENVGTRTAPVYASGRSVRNRAGRDLRMELAMMTPSAFDWDDDGKLDLICGDEDGRVAWLRNTGRLTEGMPVFDDPVYFRQQPDALGFGCLATPYCVDWDDDGDWDIVTGNSAGCLAFIENLSGPCVAEPSWAEPRLLEADGACIRIMAGEKGSVQGPIERKWGYTCLSVADWDGDGRLDVMVNSITGDVVWYRNIGTRAKPVLAGARDVEVAWEGEQPEMGFGWYQPKHKKNPKGLLTQWRTTPVMFDWNRDGRMDLIMLDKEGYLCLYERRERAGRLELLPPRRVLGDAAGRPLRLAERKHGASGRRKIAVLDWNQDGLPDLALNSRNAEILINMGTKDGMTRFRSTGDVATRRLSGHTTAPAATDFDGDGVLDLLIGAEDGFFYHKKNPHAKRDVIPIWPAGKMPGPKTANREHAKKMAPQKIWFYDISQPTLTHFPSRQKGNGKPAIVICPGGGYEFVSWVNEGTEIAEWFTKQGFEAFILKYRVPKNREGALADAQRAISYVRSQSKRWQIDPDKIGQIGFSAGANLTARTATHHAKRCYGDVDEVDRVSCRPDFSVIVYPWTLVEGDNAEKELPLTLRREFSVDARTPPAFIVQTEDDWAHVENSLAYYTACKRARVPAEMHLYAKGGHGYGMRKGPQCEGWQDLMWKWFQRLGVAGTAPSPNPQEAAGPRKRKMMTAWGRAVTAENAWREYPRPQLVRDQWECLNGWWEYEIVSNVQLRAVSVERGRILVPFAFEAPLSGVGRRIEPHEKMIYRRNVTLTPRSDRRLILNFEAVDWRTQVFVNGQEAMDVPHEGGCLPFGVDITEFVRPGENEIKVVVWDPTDTFINAGGKQNDRTVGCWYSRVSGIWQTVWLESVPLTYVRSVKIDTDVDANQVTFRVVGNQATHGAATVRIFDTGRMVAQGEAGKPIVFPDQAKRWSCENPHLYDYELVLGEDRVRGYFAMRKIDKAQDAAGHWRFRLNGKFVFPFGTLDQGWWPDGFLTPPSLAACSNDLVTLKKCGYNLIRKHIKVEPRLYYKLCDQLGILVFQDAPSPAGRDNTRDPVKNRQRYGMFRREWKEQMDLQMNIPSIVLWVPYNETWGQPDEAWTRDTLRWTRRYDPSRLVGGPSGWTDYEGGDAYDLPSGSHRIVRDPWGVESENPSCDTVDCHAYPGPAQCRRHRHRISVLGEFGGIGLRIPGHEWDDSESWGYAGTGAITDPAVSQARYLDLIAKLRPLIDDGLAAAVYTQTSDVEREINGLMTYDRAVLKYDPDVLRKAHQAVLRHAARSASGK